VVPTSVSFIRVTVADCMPIAAATVASRQNCAQPAGLAPLSSNTRVNPAIPVNSAAKAQMTSDGSPLARRSPEVSAWLPPKARPIQVLPATPAM
jgi:hypothetical protein